jgi:hypothetical protein
MFACVDGPNFDIHLVDFDEFRARIHMYDKEGKVALKIAEECRCRSLK